VILVEFFFEDNWSRDLFGEEFVLFFQSLDTCGFGNVPSAFLCKNRRLSIFNFKTTRITNIAHLTYNRTILESVNPFVAFLVSTTS